MFSSGYYRTSSNMKIAVVCLIFGYLAVAANGAAIGNGADVTVNNNQETSVDETFKETTKTETDAAGDGISDSDFETPDGLPIEEKSVPTAKAEAKSGVQKTAVLNTAKSSALDAIPYPLNVVFRAMGKNALKAMDVDTMCESIQLIDWKRYQKMLEDEDFTGFKEKLAKDQLVTAIAESLQESTTNYINKTLTAISKSMKIEGLDPVQKSLKELIDAISQNFVAQKDTGFNVQKNFKNFGETIKIDPKTQKEALQVFKKNIDQMLEALKLAQNSASAKTEVSA